MLQYILGVSSVSLVLSILGFLLVFLFAQVILDQRRDIPGPFLARFTRWWYFVAIYRGNFEETNIKLHQKYGPIVRIAPREYSIDDVEAAKIIYGHGQAFVKVRAEAVSSSPFRVEGKG
jgi:hypothetical protein